ncbi:MAG TPA: tetratricopeptide repeat protein [Gemmatimonadaceae bacterium]|nr:tetratricopeptide repeat protein [Gemmatimonadaceae bacterium]
MSNIAKLKKKAAEFELKRQPDKALSAYIELLTEYEASPEEMDVALFNRVGDLLLKQGNVADAVDYYEKAVDHYSEGGFFNNAIALCNKILRQSPGRTSVYYKLGKISAQKGFTADAKRNFLEFADRMQKAGKLDEAFRALKEFADLCPDQDDIRLMLADQLQKVGKAPEAVQQLQLLYQRYMAEDRKSEAEATAERIRSIDPDAEVRAGDTPLETKAQDLVFLDLNEAPRPARMSTQMGAPSPAAPPPPAAPRATPPVAPSIVEPTHVAGAVTAHEADAAALDGVTRATDLAAGTDAGAAQDAAPLAGLEATSFDARATGAFPASLVDLEPTSLFEPEPELPAEAEAAVEAETEVDADIEGPALELILPDDAAPTLPMPTPRSSATPASASPTAGLPLMDFEEPGRPSGEVRAAEMEATPSEGMTAGRISDVGRASTLLAAHSVEMLHAVVEGAPEDWDAHRELGEAMLEAGDREGGLHAFETAMRGYERDGNLDAAASMADEIVRADPGSVKHYQKRVEYAFRSNDKRRLVDAYLELADALFRGDQADKARVIYRRVLDLSPNDLRAQAALSALPEVPAADAAQGHGAPAGERKSRPVETPRDGGSFVNLGDLMREEEPAKDTRMVVAEEEPTGDEEADFADMLKKFKQGVAENVEEEDYQSHYDLGIAYKEMGLLDEAISEFQKALRGADKRVRTYESIGQCFMEKAQYQMAATLLGRALLEKGMSDDQLVGVLYLLGRACEELGRPADAITYYQRIFVVDIQFRDVGERMNALEKAGR